jgi:hypothetical protein
MSVGNLVILLVSVACVLVQEEEEEEEVDDVAAALDIAGAQAMVEGEFLKLMLPSIYVYL